MAQFLRQLCNFVNYLQFRREIRCWVPNQDRSKQHRDDPQHQDENPPGPTIAHPVMCIQMGAGTAWRHQPGQDAGPGALLLVVLPSVADVVVLCHVPTDTASVTREVETPIIQVDNNLRPNVHQNKRLALLTTGLVS